MEVGFHLLRRAGCDENFISEVARIMEYSAAYAVAVVGLRHTADGTSHRRRADGTLNRRNADPDQ
jgi:hypothetical protein